jgi:hypothetical protein
LQTCRKYKGRNRGWTSAPQSPHELKASERQKSLKNKSEKKKKIETGSQNDYRKTAGMTYLSPRKNISIAIAIYPGT